MIFTTLVLAAGAGTRMRSAKAKVAHELLDRPLVCWVIDAAKAAGSERVITVVGHQREQVIPLVEDTIVGVQEERLGTGHTIMIARDVLESALDKGVEEAAGVTTAKTSAHRTASTSSLVVLCGDTPLITAQTIADLVTTQQSSGAAVCVLTHMLDDPTNYGRIVRNEAGEVLGIVEEKDASAKQRKIKECNSGAYCFDLRILLDCIDELDCNNAQGEYYLTDIVGICVRKGLVAKAQVVSAEETQGINSRLQLAQATKSMQRRINTAHMLAGVTMLDPDLVWIGADVVLESDVELLPLTMIYGSSEVGSGSCIGPNTRIYDSVIGRDCCVEESVLKEATLGDGVSCGPRAYLRPGTKMLNGSKAGTHVEIKNSTIGEGSKVPHLSYIGDATLGVDVNVGAGTITCNYDGVRKYATTIGDRSFIGSDTMLVAPLEVGSDVTTGAGSVITKKVPDGALAIERSEQKVIEGWSARHRK